MSFPSKVSPELARSANYFKSVKVCIRISGFTIGGSFVSLFFGLVHPESNKKTAYKIKTFWFISFPPLNLNICSPPK
jgi:hypothetical protein